MRSAADSGTPRVLAHVQILRKLMKRSRPSSKVRLCWRYTSGLTPRTNLEFQPCGTGIIPMVTAAAEMAQGEGGSSSRCWRLTQGCRGPGHSYHGGQSRIRQGRSAHRNGLLIRNPCMTPPFSPSFSLLPHPGQGREVRHTICIH